MYTEHFGFSFDPFEPGYRPERFFHATRGRTAMFGLQSAINGGDNIMILSGPSGSGKTTLLKHFANSLSDRRRILFLEGGVGTFEEVVDYVFAALKLEAPGFATGEKLNEIYRFLRNTESSSERILLIIDNAEKLPATAIKQISYLSQASKTGNLQILFVGTPQIEPRFKDNVLEPVAAQIKHWIRLGNLKNDEVGSFIDHCLKKAGYKGTKLFSPGSIESLIRHSGGNPRLVMNLCGFSLLSASIENADMVTRQMIDEVATDCIFIKESENCQESAEGTGNAGLSNLIPLIRKSGKSTVEKDSGHPDEHLNSLRRDAVLSRCRELGIPHPDIDDSETPALLSEESNLP